MIWKSDGIDLTVKNRRGSRRVFHRHFHFLIVFIFLKKKSSEIFSAVTPYDPLRF